MAEKEKRPPIFECLKLFQVEASTPAAGGEKPIQTFDSQTSSSIGIELCCWRECRGHSVLALVCNNGYLVLHVTPSHGQPIIKQLKWFESPQQHILDLTLDPLGQWLACACLDGAVCLIPVMALMLDCAPTHSFGALDDLTMIYPIKKRASPTCVVWWESMDDRHICITGSEVGEVTFFDLLEKQDVATVYVSGCINSLLIAHHTDIATHLLIGMRGGEWWRIMVEEHYHEAAGTSYTDAHASGFEVLPDDVVIKSYLQKRDPSDGFEVKPCNAFSELTRLSTHDWKNQHFLGSLNLRTNKLEVYSYDLELFSTPVRVHKLVAGATNALLTDRLLFVISHDDEASSCSCKQSKTGGGEGLGMKLLFTFTVMSCQRTAVTELDEGILHSNAIIQQFKIPSLSNIVGFYSTSRDSPILDGSLSDSRGGRRGSTLTPTQLGGCLIVTTTAVYQCKQRLSPESIFLDMALSSKMQERAENFGITFRLDICGLYKVAAEQKLAEKKYSQALKLFELSRCSTSHIIESFSRVERNTELVQYLHQFFPGFCPVWNKVEEKLLLINTTVVVYDDTGHGSLVNPKEVQNVLLKCFIHECLRQHNKPEGTMMLDKLSLFINDKFLYNHALAMEMLVQSGLKEQLLELAKTHHRLSEVLGLLVKHGSMEIDPSLQASLANKQYVDTLCQAANGLFLYQMTPSTFVRLLIAKPSIIPRHLKHLHSLLPKLDISTLLRVARLFDPSLPTIRPLLVKANSHRQRSNSTGSMTSLISGSESSSISQEDSIPRLEAFVETFLIALVILNCKRKQKPSSLSLFSLSQLRSSVTDGKGDQQLMKLLPEWSQWLKGSPVSCGLHHAAAVVDGHLYTWGATKNGKLGHGDIEEEGKAMPLRVETMSMLSIHVVSVSCGAEHTIALCQEGVFSWGSSIHGQLGLGDTMKRTRPVQIAALADKSTTSVVCGQYHSLALDDEHRLWSWGWGVHGQLGLESVDNKLLPTHASLLDSWQVSFIAAGYGHSAVLTAEGKVLTFGNGMYGQLGHGDSEKQSAAKMVRALEGKVVYLLACGNFHTVAVSTDQCIYYWGKNLHRPRPGTNIQSLKEYKRSRQRQAASAPIANTLVPQAITDTKLDDVIIQVSCGSFHSLLLTVSGSVYSWGSNMHGQLGHQHTAELPQPKKIASFDGYKIVAIAAGDEFSLVVDDKSTPWVWGRADHGELGQILPTSSSSRGRGGSEGHRNAIFTPSQITSITTRKSREPSPAEGTDFPILELDLGWELPDFASIGSPHIPYGREALDSALDNLHGFYRTSVLLWQCQDWKDWETMARIHDTENQWAQGLGTSLRAFSACDKERICALAEEYLQKFVSSVKCCQSPGFVSEGMQMVQKLIFCWEQWKFEFSQLETILLKHLKKLCYSLSLVLRSVQNGADFSFDFHVRVASEVIGLICNGTPMPEDVLSASKTEQAESEEATKVLLETSVGDSRLWAEVLRNLSKDLSKQSAVHISESTLTAIESYKSKTLLESASNINQKLEDIVAFSCGHAFSLAQFHSKILLDFMEKVQDFPVPIPHTVRHLQMHFKQSNFLSSACPYCVFQYLRKLQLQECPGVPIRPWNP